MKQTTTYCDRCKQKIDFGFYLLGASKIKPDTLAELCQNCFEEFKKWLINLFPMQNKLKQLALIRLDNPFDKEKEFEQWNQFDMATADFHNAIQVMRNLLCECTTKPRRTKEQLDSMIQKIKEAN